MYMLSMLGSSLCQRILSKTQSCEWAAQTHSQLLSQFVCFVLFCCHNHPVHGMYGTWVCAGRSQGSTKLHPAWFDIFTGAADDRGGRWEQWWRGDTKLKRDRARRTRWTTAQQRFCPKTLTWSLRMWNLPICQGWAGLQEQESPSLKEGLDQEKKKKWILWKGVFTKWGLAQKWMITGVRLYRGGCLLSPGGRDETSSLCTRWRWKQTPAHGPCFGTTCVLLLYILWWSMDSFRESLLLNWSSLSAQNQCLFNRSSFSEFPKHH